MLVGGVKTSYIIESDVPMSFLLFVLYTIGGIKLFEKRFKVRDLISRTTNKNQ